MKLPRKRAFIAFHRWLGILSALFLLLLAFTGLALNHTEKLGLDRVTIQNEWVLKRYGMERSSEMQSFRIGESGVLTHMDGYLFLDSTAIGEGGVPSGSWVGDKLTVVSTEFEIFLLTPEGELVEKLEMDHLPGSRISGLGRLDDGSPLLVTDSGPWEADKDWLEFTRYTGDFSMPELIKIPIPSSHRRELLDQYRGEGVSLYRVILDLHTGRLLGLAGRTVMDLTALAVILLVSSGIAGWLRKSRTSRVQERGPSGQAG